MYISLISYDSKFGFNKLMAPADNSLTELLNAFPSYS